MHFNIYIKINNESIYNPNELYVYRDTIIIYTQNISFFYNICCTYCIHYIYTFNS